MVTLYTGTPGSGKSYHSTVDIIGYLKKNKNVIANYELMLNNKRLKIKGKFTYMRTEDMTASKLVEYAKINHKKNRRGNIVEGQTLLVIDECSIIFNSREYSRSDRMAWITFLQQHRKLGYNVRLICQQDRMIDRQIRGFVEYEVKHRKMTNFKLAWKILALFKGYNLFGAITYWYGNRERIGFEAFSVKRLIADTYNTSLIFGEEEKEDEQIKNASPADEEVEVVQSDEKSNNDMLADKLRSYLIS